ncbi:hypothetical protein L873DRAFT_1790115 [Choiromyces venosus 120613-1]|uniref:BTB domain-containing protein n=1 Tax=Choiromyces venosus 120613-1 TaxID=1336337 RepID=A0A3N4JN55_9PEZI|nr:hypothetical protein L873DRAFT_1790115 [Choiromyces venosus 120613-1]
MSANTGDSKPRLMAVATGTKSSRAGPWSPFDSQVFQITAEGGARRLYAHGSILSKHSQPFRSVVEGNWKESFEHIIDLNDWDGDTVERLLYFLHTENYHWPIPKKLLADKFGSSEGKNKKFTFESPPPPTKPETFDMSRPLTPVDQLFVANETLARPLDYNAWLSTIKPANYDLGDLFLCHAKIYALANYKDIQRLKRLALERMLKTLTALGTIQNGPREVTYITELLKYVYENTTSLVSSREPMRKLVVRFTASNLTTLNFDNEISVLMGTNADLAKDLMSDVTRRVQALESEKGSKAKRYISDIELCSRVTWPCGFVTDSGEDFEEQACTSFRKGYTLKGGYIHDKNDVLPIPKAKGVLGPIKEEGSPGIRHLLLLRTTTATVNQTPGLQLEQSDKVAVLASINQHSILSPAGALPFLHLMWRF